MKSIDNYLRPYKSLYDDLSELGLSSEAIILLNISIKSPTEKCRNAIIKEIEKSKKYKFNSEHLVRSNGIFSLKKSWILKLNCEVRFGDLGDNESQRLYGWLSFIAHHYYSKIEIYRLEV